MMTSASMTANGETNEDCQVTGFLHGSSDSFYNFSDSGQSAGPLSENAFSSVDAGDFISTVTMISQVYQREQYLVMPSLDKVSWEYLDGGRIFSVSRSLLRYNTASALKQRNSVTTTTKIVIKRSKRDAMTTDDYRSFNRELRVLDHLKDCRNIVTLRGVGWFYNYDNIHPVPQPVIVLEQAHATMQLLVSPSASLTIKTLMSVFRDVANGLAELHRCEIVHGDIKPDNVLLFLSERFDDGVPVEMYTAKISDFNLSLLDTGLLQTHLGGTQYYNSPEHGRPLTFAQLKQSDIYSLGILYAAVASSSEDFQDVSSSLMDHDDFTLPELFATRVIHKAQNITEGTSMEPSLLRLSRRLFDSTIRLEPSHRSLEQLLDSFDAYFHTPGSLPVSESATACLVPTSTANLTIGYGHFKHLSGIVKDKIVEGLDAIILSGHVTEDPRYPKALFERGVVELSRFASPAASEAQGLATMYDAALAGDLRAKALYGTLCAAYSCAGDGQYRSHQTQWLIDAASSGYQPAFDQLRALDSRAAHDARVVFAARCLALTFDPGTVESDSRDDVGNMLDRPSVLNHIHAAAATGRFEALSKLLTNNPGLLDAPNDIGDTPLMSAVRFGQYETSTMLLRHSANASVANHARENPLHFLWQFTYDEAQSLLPLLLARGADPRQEASYCSQVCCWDLIPIVSGAPLERIAGRNRLDIVKLLFSVDIRPQPRNGNQMRRMLLLALRLQHTDMQDFLLQYASIVDDDWHSGLRDLGDTIWYYKGHARTFMDAAMLGWVKHTGTGPNVPVGFWQACYHGAEHAKTMAKSIQLAMSLKTLATGAKERKLDRAIELALDEHAYEAVRCLLELKVLITDGDQSRLKSLQHLRWSHERPIVDVAFIDQIFCAQEKTTLAQQALWRGDRMLFHIAVREYGANMTLPFLDSPQPQEAQMNCYAAISYTDHHDLWFCAELVKLGIVMSCPFELDEKHPADSPWRSPLHYALKNQSWSVCDWLIKNGASPFRNYQGERGTLENLLVPGKIPRGLLRYLFPHGSEQRSTTWCVLAEDRSFEGYNIFRSLYRTIEPAMETVWQLQEDGHRRPAHPIEELPGHCHLASLHAEDNRGHHNFNQNEEVSSQLDQHSGEIAKPKVTANPEMIMSRIAVQADEVLACWLRLLECYPKVHNKPYRRERSILGMTVSICQKLPHFDTGPVNIELRIVPTVLMSIWISFYYDVRMRLRISQHEDQPGRQPIKNALCSLLLGSPLDRLSRSEFNNSGLLRYGYFPSLRNSWTWNPVPVVPFLPPVLFLLAMSTLSTFSVFNGKILNFLAFWGFVMLDILTIFMVVTFVAMFFIFIPCGLCFGMYHLVWYICRKIHKRTGRDFWPYIEHVVHAKWIGRGNEVYLWLPE